MKKNQYYMEGVEAFNKTLDRNNENNPYQFTTKKEIEKRNCWFDGFREAAKKYFNKKYDVSNLQEEIRNSIFSRGLTMKFDDEYGLLYAETPEGYIIRLGEES